MIFAAGSRVKIFYKFRVRNEVECWGNPTLITPARVFAEQATCARSLIDHLSVASVSFRRSWAMFLGILARG